MRRPAFAPHVEFQPWRARVTEVPPGLSRGEALLQREKDIRREFLKLLETGVSGSRAALQLGITRYEMYFWRWKYPIFAQDCQKAQAWGLYGKLKPVMRRYGVELIAVPLPCSDDTNVHLKQPGSYELQRGKLPAWLTSGDRPECVPHARSTGRGTEGGSKRGLAARDGHK
jgi:hypothetical protein